MHPYSYDNCFGRLVAGIVLVILTIMICGCSDNAPEPQPEMASMMPADFMGTYLGMTKEEIDKIFPISNTRLSDIGLETNLGFTRDSVKIGIAFAYRDGGLLIATLWYDCVDVPQRVDSLRRDFLDYLIDRNGPDFQPCSFTIPGATFVPDIGLYWRHPGFGVVATFAKRRDNLPDSVNVHPYYQFCVFDSSVAPQEIWSNIVIPAKPEEMPYFQEVDSLRENVLQRKPTLR